MANTLEEYKVNCLDNSRIIKGESYLHGMIPPDKNANADACMIHVTKESFRHYTFWERVEHLKNGKRPVRGGTGTIINDVVLTVAHLFVTEHKTMILQRNIFAVYRPISIFQGITSTGDGKKYNPCNYNGEPKYIIWSENEERVVSVKVQEDLIIERDIWGEISVANHKSHDLAIILGTGLKNNTSINLIDDFRTHKNKKNLTQAVCYHYPKSLLPQKKSKGYVALNSSCNESPLVHHDLVSTHGSSGAGIKDELNNIFAVLCSGPDCRDEFKGHHYNHCIPVDKNVVSCMEYDVIKEDRMRFTNLAAMMIALFPSSATSAVNDLDSSHSSHISRHGVFTYSEVAEGGIMKGTYTPYKPEPLWRRAMVFAPTFRMVRMPLAVAIPTCFFLEKYWEQRLRGK